MYPAMLREASSGGKQHLRRLPPPPAVLEVPSNSKQQDAAEPSPEPQGEDLEPAWEDAKEYLQLEEHLRKLHEDCDSVAEELELAQNSARTLEERCCAEQRGATRLKAMLAASEASSCEFRFQLMAANTERLREQALASELADAHRQALAEAEHQRSSAVAVAAAAETSRAEVSTLRVELGVAEEARADLQVGLGEAQEAERQLQQACVVQEELRAALAAAEHAAEAEVAEAVAVEAVVRTLQCELQDAEHRRCPAAESELEQVQQLELELQERDAVVAALRTCVEEAVLGGEHANARLQHTESEVGERHEKTLELLEELKDATLAGGGATAESECLRAELCAQSEWLGAELCNRDSAVAELRRELHEVEVAQSESFEVERGDSAGAELREKLCEEEVAQSERIGAELCERDSVLAELRAKLCEAEAGADSKGRAALAGEMSSGSTGDQRTQGEDTPESPFERSVCPRDPTLLMRLEECEAEAAALRDRVRELELYVQEHDSAVADLRSHLVEAQSDEGRLEVEVRERDAAVADLQSHLREVQEDAAGSGQFGLEVQECDAAAAELRLRLDEVEEACHQRVGQLELEVQERDVGTADLRVHLREAEAEACADSSGQLQLEVKERDAVAATLRSELQQATAEGYSESIEQLELEVQERDVAAAHLHTQLREAEAKVEAVFLEGAEQLAPEAWRPGAVAADLERVGQLELEVQERDAGVATLRSRVEQAEEGFLQQLHGLESEVRERDSVAAELSRELREANAEHESSAERLLHLELDMQDLDATIAELREHGGAEGSTSPGWTQHLELEVRELDATAVELRAQLAEAAVASESSADQMHRLEAKIRERDASSVLLQGRLDEAARENECYCTRLQELETQLEERNHAAAELLHNNGSEHTIFQLEQRIKEQDAVVADLRAELEEIAASAVKAHGLQQRVPFTESEQLRTSARKTSCGSLVGTVADASPMAKVSSPTSAAAWGDMGLDSPPSLDSSEEKEPASHAEPQKGNRSSSQGELPLFPQSLGTNSKGSKAMPERCGEMAERDAVVAELQERCEEASRSEQQLLRKHLAAEQELQEREERLTAAEAELSRSVPELHATTGSNCGAAEEAVAEVVALRGRLSQEMDVLGGLRCELADQRQALTVAERALGSAREEATELSEQLEDKEYALLITSEAAAEFGGDAEEPVGIREARRLRSECLKFEAELRAGTDARVSPPDKEYSMTSPGRSTADFGMMDRAVPNQSFVDEDDELNPFNCDAASGGSRSSSRGRGANSHDTLPDLLAAPGISQGDSAAPRPAGSPNFGRAVDIADSLDSASTGLPGGRGVTPSFGEVPGLLGELEAMRAELAAERAVSAEAREEARGAKRALAEVQRCESQIGDPADEVARLRLALSEEAAKSRRLGEHLLEAEKSRRRLLRTLSKDAEAEAGLGALAKVIGRAAKAISTISKEAPQLSAEGTLSTTPCKTDRGAVASASPSAESFSEVSPEDLL